MKPVSIFLSPHLDDAVFSCAAQILAEVERGCRVVIATLFSAGPGALYRQRRNEDREAARLLGAEAVWLDLPDAPFRDRFYHDFRTLIFGTAEKDNDFLGDVTRTIDEVCAEFRPAMVHVPLAVGTHIDHRLAFAAALRLRERRPLRFYEDRPYALVRHAVALRLASLGVRHELVDAREYLQSFQRAPYVVTYLPPGADRAWCMAALRLHIPRSAPAHGVTFTPEIHRADLRALRRIRRALLAYESQTAAFLGAPARFFRAIRAHGRGYAERSWHASAREISRLPPILDPFGKIPDNSPSPRHRPARASSVTR